MALPQMTLFLACAPCDHVEPCSTEKLLVRLRESGALRRNDKPEAALIRQLVEESIHQWSCQRCGKRGLQLTDSDPADDIDWGGTVASRPCEKCQSPIAPGRLEALPDATLCTQCQAQRELGVDEAPEQADYCPRCGSIRQMRYRSGNYHWFCPSCRR